MAWCARRRLVHNQQASTSDQRPDRLQVPSAARCDVHQSRTQRPPIRSLSLKARRRLSANGCCRMHGGARTGAETAEARSVSSGTREAVGERRTRRFAPRWPDGGPFEHAQALEPARVSFPSFPCASRSEVLGRARKSARGRRSANPLRCRAEWMVPPPRLERGTPRSTIWCSNQLSYGGTGGRCIVGRGSFQGDVCTVMRARWKPGCFGSRTDPHRGPEARPRRPHGTAGASRLAPSGRARLQRDRARL